MLLTLCNKTCQYSHSNSFCSASALIAWMNLFNLIHNQGLSKIDFETGLCIHAQIIIMLWINHCFIIKILYVIREEKINSRDILALVVEKQMVFIYPNDESIQQELHRIYRVSQCLYQQWTWTLLLGEPIFFSCWWYPNSLVPKQSHNLKTFKIVRLVFGDKEFIRGTITRVLFFLSILIFWFLK